ncbi:DUF1343 domain-containing protein [Alteromonas sp. D210916BOD_24]|uniref:exo-beta-N-acetylmuramidase NamZ family protein n=1 Tax=Alteromonas sp. D210916BOD_24 TaxID=3157618 RepID=UPI00399D3C66
MVEPATTATLKVGAERLDAYLPLLQNKRVGLVVNQSALVRNNHISMLPSQEADVSSGKYAHLLDVMLSHDIEVNAVMSPEHGFRGDKGAGEIIENGRDVKTGLPVFSLYGKTKKPTADMLANIDVIVFDIQDVGVRFYTYLSTLHYVIEAAFQHNIDVIVLDRPNPNGRYIDGPTLESAFSSFVGMHPIPVLHGMTLGELAQMIVGEKWAEIPANSTSTLKVIPVSHYDKYQRYSLPVAPSPNLPNDAAISLYPTLCFFEGTDISIGRGTAFPFQLIGHPTVPIGEHRLTVTATSAAPAPKHENATLYADMLVNTHTRELIKDNESEGLNIDVLVNTYKRFNLMKHEDDIFFTRPAFFDKLAGTNRLREMMESGASAAQIRDSWQQDLVSFKRKRLVYLLYPDKR